MAATFERERPSTMPGQTEPIISHVESTFPPGVLPGLASRSPIGTPSASPPPYHMKDGRSDSPTTRLPEAIEPLDVTRSQIIAEPGRKPTNAYHQSISSGRVRTSDEDLDWPLPSPFRDQSPKKEAPNTPSLVTVRKSRPPSSNSESPWPLPSPPTSLGRGEALAGSSSPGPVLSRGARQASPSASERNLSRQSPFDDANASDSASEYSVSIRDKRPRSSMLNVPEEKHINDDGISEMSASSHGSNRRSRLNQRASDEISAVSSLGDSDNIGGQFEAGTGSQQSVVTALPHTDDT
ncbi:hypothetical protein EPUS_01014 [Endocarpon pusillum Z07020]|uniref:Uncharacterized protein n=1 Tax=Endocarpon pusillum (strain Z07020 / HMAS-L-300199) TaxID=1263415 RepID=U1GAL7_ENDPU|nr:uncharacterized protein EPUS_01014 [Endocarpon pusillum Z07020]ERF69058.1 hypothetical protein EPUS_01014 [Endocarpon pusillum Z07020]